MDYGEDIEQFGYQTPIRGQIRMDIPCEGPCEVQPEDEQEHQGAQALDVARGLVRKRRITMTARRIRHQDARGRFCGREQAVTPKTSGYYPGGLPPPPPPKDECPFDQAPSPPADIDVTLLVSHRAVMKVLLPAALLLAILLFAVAQLAYKAGKHSVSAQPVAHHTVKPVVLERGMR